MPKFTSLSDRMKFYEKLTGNLEYLLPLAPAVIRLDGRAFHSFTKGLQRPFDMGLVDLMVETTKYLVKETGALMGYTQSDEISLLIYSDSWDSQVYFDGRASKIKSVLPTTCSNFFNSKLKEYLPNKSGKLAEFDCRFSVFPTKEEAVNNFVWRELDATRNSIQMLGQAHFSPKQLHEKSCDDIQEMLWSKKNLNWNNLPAQCKRGTYVRTKVIQSKFDPELDADLPEKHQARINPDLVISRSRVEIMEMPPITKVPNRVEVFFDGVEVQERIESLV